VAYSMTLLSSNRVCSWPGSFTFQMGNVLGNPGRGYALQPSFSVRRVGYMGSILGRDKTSGIFYDRVGPTIGYAVGLVHSLFKWGMFLGS